MKSVSIAVRHSFRFVVIGACLAVGSCSLLVDVDGLSGPDVPSADASITTGDSQPTDGPTAEGRVDSGVDSGKETGPPTPFCANVDANFCDDFDEPARAFLLGNWDFAEVSAGGAAILDTTDPRSPPRAARFTYAANVPPPGTGCNHERLFRSVPLAPKSHLTLSFSAWLGDANGELEPTDILAHLNWIDGPVDCLLLWSPARPTGALREKPSSATEVVHAIAAGPPAGAWHRYAIDVDLTNRELRFEIDGVNALRAGEKVAATCPAAPTRVSISLGFFCAQNRVFPSEVRFDDVTLHVR